MNYIGAVDAVTMWYYVPLIVLHVLRVAWYGSLPDLEDTWLPHAVIFGLEAPRTLIIELVDSTIGILNIPLWLFPFVRDWVLCFTLAVGLVTLAVRWSLAQDAKDREASKERLAALDKLGKVPDKAVDNVDAMLAASTAHDTEMQNKESNDDDDKPLNPAVQEARLKEQELLAEQVQAGAVTGSEVREVQEVRKVNAKKRSRREVDVDK